jgi:hypothetical protein
MPLPLTNNIRTNSGKPLDDWRFNPSTNEPYTSKAEVISIIAQPYRKGKEVRIKENGIEQDYWFVSPYLTVDDLVLKINISSKVDKVTGKQLSTEDYTTSDKSKLASIQSGITATSILSQAAINAANAAKLASTITTDATHRFVSDADKDSWNAIQAFTAALNTVQSTITHPFEELLIYKGTGTKVFTLSDVPDNMGEVYVNLQPLNPFIEYSFSGNQLIITAELPTTPSQIRVKYNIQYPFTTT